MNIGLAIKLARENLGFTRKDLAGKTRLSPSMITRIEKGERVPSLLVAMHISKALGFHFSQLLTIAESVFEPDNEIKNLQGKLLLSIQPILAQVRSA